MKQYNVEVREPLQDGDDYSEEDYEFDTPEEVKKFIKGLSSNESVHSVLYYAPGTNCNPKDLTHKF